MFSRGDAVALLRLLDLQSAQLVRHGTLNLISETQDVVQYRQHPLIARIPIASRIHERFQKNLGLAKQCVSVAFAVGELVKIEHCHDRQHEHDVDLARVTLPVRDLISAGLTSKRLFDLLKRPLEVFEALVIHLERTVQPLHHIGDVVLLNPLDKEDADISLDGLHHVFVFLDLTDRGEGVAPVCDAGGAPGRKGSPVERVPRRSQNLVSWDATKQF